MTVKLLTEHHLEFLSLRGGCTGSSEYALVEITCHSPFINIYLYRDSMVLVAIAYVLAKTVGHVST